MLTCERKDSLFSALKVNAKEENRSYKYDFLFDNCTTRARDMVAGNSGAPVRFGNILPPKAPSFRDLIHSYLDAGHQPWSKLGIDILLGVRLDRRVTNKEAMFLPDYLLKGFDSAHVGNGRLVHPPVKILDVPSPLRDGPAIGPAAIFWLLFLLITALSFLKNRAVRRSLLIFDFLFFFILGLAGLLLLFMWFGTDHAVCRYNFNLAWALPTHVVMAFYVHSPKGKRYFRVVAWISLVLALAWFFLPQSMNPALFPIVLLILFRSWRISKTKQNGPSHQA
jgi:hypothetical protein